MPGEIERFALSRVRDRLARASAVALVGPRQVGKTTLALSVGERWPSGSAYFDLEAPPDVDRLADPYRALAGLAPRLGIVDEAQRLPGIFPVLRSVIDQNRRAGRRAGQFLLLGSAWLDLTMASTESLAGRVSLVELGGINIDEAAGAGIDADTLWLRGGFPDALLAETNQVSQHWRTDLIATYLERDVPQSGRRVPAETLRRLWTMLAHVSGGLFNASVLAENLAVSAPTIKSYVDLLVDLKLVRRLEPWFANTAKRLTKSPKIYVRDTGLLHALLRLQDSADLMAHPSVGASYESFAVECLLGANGDYDPAFYRAGRAGADEVDLVLVRGGVPKVAIEIKLASAPVVGAGFRRACDDLGVTARYVVHPDDPLGAYEKSGLTVIGLAELVGRLRRGWRAVEAGGMT
ncbi:MAG: ATP-binding protein [Propionibacteriaceae bacterium]|jgi:predicted AAA+ superfamily ATPase|nr:ATP-binding protein [Propionibacteriaceae bacterium]